MVFLSILALSFWGLNAGIDFSGGSLLEINYKTERPSVNEIEESLVDFQFKELHVRNIGDTGVVLRVKERNVSQENQNKIVEQLNKLGEIEEEAISFESISPVVGRELRRTTIIVIILSLLAVVIYIAFAFRKISQPISSWQYGIASLLALAHDILIPFGIFAVLGRFYDVQITIPVITAFLVILGYSINDTVVVFDRIRENLLRVGGENYEEIVNNSIKESLTRSINTSLTTLFVLSSLFFLGGETLKYFSLALMIGIALGTYSSLFLSGPILVSWLKRRE